MSSGRRAFLWYNVNAMKISIVTSSFNRVDTIETAMESVLAQKLPAGVELEYIVADGGSTDGTVERIKSLEKRVRQECRENLSFKWVSGRDKGIYDGFNKGLKMATGDVVGLLHTDDRYQDETVLADVLAGIEGTDAVYGDIRFVNAAGQTTRYYSSKLWKPWMHNWGYMMAHPSLYVRREIFEKYGYYDDSYKISGDFEWMVRVFCRKGVTARYLPRCMVAMGEGGASTTLKKKILMNAENVRGNRQNGYFSCFAMMLPKYAYKILGCIFKH